MQTFKFILSICLGASLGALLRWFLNLTLNKWQFSILPVQLGTLSANLIGSFLAGFAISYLNSRLTPSPTLYALIITGFLGALTTFSSFSIEVVQMILSQRYFLAFSTSFIHLTGSLLATMFAMHLYTLLFSA